MNSRRAGASLLAVGAGLGVALAVGASGAPAGTATAAATKAPAAKTKSKTVRTATIAQDGILPASPREIDRRCGRSRSNARIARRTVSRSTTTLRVATRYCGGKLRIDTTTVRTVTEAPSVSPPVTVTEPGPTQTVTAPAPPAPGGGGGPAPAPPTFKLTLLHNNDGESKLLTGDSVPSYGGVARFKTVVDRLRDEARSAETAPGQKRGTVVVSSGDNFLAGTNFTASLRRFEDTGEPFYEALAIAAIGYDAVTLGNHEFDFGPVTLADFIAGAPAPIPFVTANVDFSAEPALQALVDAGRIIDTAVVRRSGERIAIIGLTTPDLAGISSPGRVVVDDALAQIVNDEVARLEGEGIDKIVLSSHLQAIENEQALIPQLRGVDVVIAGGGDNLLAGPDDPLVPVGGDPAGGYPPIYGPYPTYVADGDGAQVPVVTTAGEYNYVGRLTAVFDSAGRIVSVDDGLSGPVRVSGRAGDADIAAPDPAVKAAIADPVAAYNAALASNVIADSEVVLEGGTPPQPVRGRETNLGDLVADAFRWSVNRTAVADGRPEADIAFANGGGIRVTLPVGDISEKNTFDVLPFANFMVTVPDVPREKLKELMEHGVAALPTNNGKFPQISGFRMEIDATRTASVVTGTGADAVTTTPGERVRELVLDDGTVIVDDGVVVPGPGVNVATADFTAKNGDNYPFGGLPYVTSGLVYQQTLYQYLVSGETVGDLTALDGQVTSARYPVAGLGRITIIG